MMCSYHLIHLNEMYHGFDKPFFSFSVLIKTDQSPNFDLVINVMIAYVEGKLFVNCFIVACHIDWSF